VHLVWEALLLAAVAVAALAVRSENADVFRGNGLRDLVVTLSVGVLLGTAFALSLRAAVPNLAVGAAAVTAGALTGWLVRERGYELGIAALVTLGAAVALGLALAVVVVGFRAPAWAASLGAALGLYAAVLSLGAGRSLLVPSAPDLRRWAWPLLAGVLLVSVGGGLLGLRRGIRDAVGRYRATGDPAAARGGGAGFVAAAALVGSTVLAATAGLLLAFRSGAVVPDDGVTLLAQAAAAALLGGTSAHGRRGGIFGTALAAAFLQLAAVWLGLVEAEPWTRPALLGGAIVVGLLVGRLVEAAGRPPEEPEEPDEVEPDPYATEAWSPYRTSTYSTAGYTPGATAAGDPGTYRGGEEPWWPGQAAPPGGGSPFRSGSDPA
jgi:ribose/xylose/arabinose/galactoside ABC-type transport system permease subunit